MKRSKNYNLCKKYIHKHVRVITTHGTYEGQIVKLDNQRVYLKPVQDSNKAQVSFFFPFIIPLVLFDLLVIILLESRPFRRPFI